MPTLFRSARGCLWIMGVGHGVVKGTPNFDDGRAHARKISDEGAVVWGRGRPRR